MSWHQGWMTAFDLETTGVDPDTARIVTATIVHIKGAQTERRSWLVNPGIPIPAEATAVRDHCHTCNGSGAVWESAP